MNTIAITPDTGSTSYRNRIPAPRDRPHPKVLLLLMPNNRLPPDLQHLSSVYLGLLVSGGQIGLPIVVVAALVCKKLTWHPTIINFCISWMVYSVIYSLYLYAGAANEDDQHLKICMVQASMIHGAAPMAVVAGLAIVLHTWTTLQCLQCTVLSRMPRMLYLILAVWELSILTIPCQMLGTPYLVFVVFSLSAGIFVLSRPQSVGSNGLYCVIQPGCPAVIVPAFCAAVMLIILTLEAVITIQYYRQWKVIKASFPLATRTPSRSLCFRVGLFCLYSCVTFTSAILFLSDLQTEVTYMLPAALPLGAFIVFGLRQEVISWWTSILHPRDHSPLSSELEVPSARPTSRSDPTLAATGLCEGSPKEPGVLV